MPEPRFSLYFYGDRALELLSTSFSLPAHNLKIACHRGRTPGAYQSTGSFQWSKAVQGVCHLMMVAALLSKRGGPAKAQILGMAGSVAQSLDYAISKQPIWLIDMFGCDSKGESFARRLFHRGNSGRKFAGPVTVCLNHKFLPYSEIEVTVNDTLVTEVDELDACLQSLASLESDDKEQKRERGVAVTTYPMFP